MGFKFLNTLHGRIVSGSPERWESNHKRCYKCQKSNSSAVDETPKKETLHYEVQTINTGVIGYLLIFRWFKFTLKPPYSIACGKLQLAIWDTSF